MTSLDKRQHSEQPTGSPSEGEPVFLVVGKLRRPHGVRGELLMDIYTDFPERLRKGVGVFLGDAHEKMKIHSARSAGNSLLVALEGIDTPEKAGMYRNQLIFVRADDRPALPEGEYYHHQLLGLRVVSDEGQLLGTLAEIMDLPANDVYVIRPEQGAEILLPAIESVIQTVDLQKGEIRVKLIPGLLPD